MTEKKEKNNVILMPQMPTEQLKAPAKKKPAPQVPAIHIHKGSDAPAAKPVQGTLLEPGDFVYSTLQAQIGRVKDEIKSTQDAIEKKENRLVELEKEYDNLHRAADETRKMVDEKQAMKDGAKRDQGEGPDKKTSE